MRSSRGFRPTTTQTGQCSANKALNTLLNVVVMIMCLFIGYITGVNKAVTSKVNCNQYVSDMLGHGEHGSNAMSPLILEMESIIESSVEERVANAFDTCLGQFNIKFLFYILKKQEDLEMETRKEIIANQCLPRLATVLEKWDALQIKEDGSYGVDLNDSEQRSIEKIIADLMQKQQDEDINKLDLEKNQESDRTLTSTERSVFPKGTSMFASYAVTTKKRDFLKAFDYGYPEDQNGIHELANEVLILYGGDQYVPNNIGSEMDNKREGIPFINDPVAATAKCNEMSVVVTRAHCLAIMNAYESHHIQRWMRSEGKLKHVSRGLLADGYENFKPAMGYQTRRHWDALRTYFNALEATIKELKPIAEKININNTIVSMVCNFGQSSLLMNFACSSRARGFDISNVLVFATDQETLELAQSLGLNAYFDEKNFGQLPKDAAKTYGDRKFTSMMYAKVLAVQLIIHMGYDCLFQDVDMHWYKNPLKAFHDPTSPLQNFDILFQSDGARSQRYAPYDANSGFYYVRQSDKTRFLFNSFLLMADMIIVHGSHQQYLNALLAEHSSLTGLKVKTLGVNGYPGGWDYHSRGRYDYLRKIPSGTTEAEIFHMSWTENKDNKVRFMKQMGMWYFKDECFSKQLNEIDVSSSSKGRILDYFSFCCSKEPMISCYYRDKPSVIDCSSSPPMDDNAASYWT